jgi:hypothetical protein
MSKFVPIFDKIVDSSIWRENDLVVKVFITMLAKQDADHVVRADAYIIGEWARKTEEEAEDALRVLSSPDTKRRMPQPHEGRRIERVEDGWLILNGDKYQGDMRKIFQRARKADWAAKKRAKERAMEEMEMERAARGVKMALVPTRGEIAEGQV